MKPRACTKCGEVGGAEAFAASRGYADGHQRICKTCMRVARNEWRKRGGTAKENATPAALARKAKYKKTDKGIASQQKPENRAAAVARVARWQKANPLKVKASGQNVRAKKIGLAERVTGEQMEELFTSYAGLCVYCNGAATEVDHVVPLARGGSNGVENLVPACEACNASKKNSPLIVWLARRAA